MASKTKRLLLILHSPFLDRIPNLKALIFHLMDNGWKVTVLSSKSQNSEILTSNHPNLKVISFNQRSRKFEAPTILKLIAYAISLCFTHSYDCVIGGDAFGNIIAKKFSKIKRIPHWFFALEFPAIIDDRHPELSVIDKKENKALVSADFIITHDKWHEKFIREHFAVKGKIFHLPNASITPCYKDKSCYLSKEFNIPTNNTILLHSGGFLDVFRCKELISQAINWPDNLTLVYHTSHRVQNHPFYKEISENFNLSKIKLSLNPLDNETLDKMIASCHIGLALYSKELLGYRAELMGLAGGKIGNYLKCGIPVIASRMPSLKYLEEYGAGILIDDESEIPSVAARIMEKYSEYKQHAYECYNNLWEPTPYMKEINNEMGK